MSQVIIFFKYYFMVLTRRDVSVTISKSEFYTLVTVTNILSCTTVDRVVSNNYTLVRSNAIDMIEEVS